MPHNQALMNTWPRQLLPLLLALLILGLASPSRGDTPLQITAGPVSRGVGLGATVTFSVTTTGTEPLAFQWKKDGARLFNNGRITRVTSSTMKIAGVQPSDFGTYYCTVSSPSYQAGVDSTTATLSYGTRLLVDARSTVTKTNGLTWATAYRRVQTGLNDAVTYKVPEVWVARGTYYEAITLKSNVALYGGFSGTETSREQRNPALNRVVVNGSTARSGKPAYHVVTMSKTSSSTLDGVTITGGVANDGVWNSQTDNNGGGGMLCLSLNKGLNRINDCIFRGNRAWWYGGAMAIDSRTTAVLVSNCTFTDNSSDYGGGAIFCYLYSSPSFANCLFSGNRSQSYAGAVSLHTQSSPSFTNCIFSGNITNYQYATFTLNDCAPTLTNCTISGNTGGLYCDNNSSPTLHNTILTNNSGGAVFVRDSSVSTSPLSSPVAIGCLFRGNANGDYVHGTTVLSGVPAISTLPGWSDNRDGDPAYLPAPSGAWTAAPVFDSATSRTLFTDVTAGFVPGSLKGCLITLNTLKPIQALIDDNGATTVSVFGQYDDPAYIGASWRLVDYHLGVGSAAIDTALTSGLMPETDYDIHPRPVDIYGVGGSGLNSYDIGAFEEQGTTLTVTSTYGNFGQPSPALGTHHVVSGTPVAASIHSPLPLSKPGSRMLCTGWIGTGSVPARGLGAATTVTITRPSTLAWQWQRQNLLTVSASPPQGGTVTPVSDWFNAGSTVNLAAVPNERYHFAGWGGDASGQDPAIRLSMLAPRTVTAYFVRDSGTVRISVVPSTVQWTLVDGSGKTRQGTGGAELRNVDSGLLQLTWMVPSGYYAPGVNPVIKTLPRDGAVDFLEVFVPLVNIPDQLVNRITRYLLGLSTDRTGLDLNSDGNVDVVDLELATQRKPPHTPALTWPADGATTVSASPRLDWADTPCTTEYQVYLWPDGTARPATPTTSGLTMSDCQPAALKYSTTYHWQVVAVNVKGGTPPPTAASPVWSFTTKPQPLTVISPNGGERLKLGGHFTMHWKSDVRETGTGVAFELWRQGQKIRYMGHAANLQGEEQSNLYMPPDLPPGNDYRMRVISTWVRDHGAGPDSFDESDGPITLAP